MDMQTGAPHVGASLDRLRTARPLVQIITNFVSMDMAANAMLAIGASPAMVHAPEETEDFLGLARALVINIGTLSRDWLQSMEVAVSAAAKLGRPWVLDPVGAGATRFRDMAVADLLRSRPALIRGNASEIMAVARVRGITGRHATPKGVDSAHSIEEAADLAAGLALAQKCIVVATGPVDLVTDGRRHRRIANGHPWMSQITATGCALSAVCGAFLAADIDALDAATAACACFGVAGDIAARQARGPASFRVAFLDALDALDGPLLDAHLRMTGD